MHVKIHFYICNCFFKNKYSSFCTHIYVWRLFHKPKIKESGQERVTCIYHTYHLSLNLSGLKYSLRKKRRHTKLNILVFREKSSFFMMFEKSFLMQRNHFDKILFLFKSSLLFQMKSNSKHTLIIFCSN